MISSCRGRIRNGGVEPDDGLVTTLFFVWFIRLGWLKVDSLASTWALHLSSTLTAKNI